MKAPFILVCPTRNSSLYIEKCLTSLARQDFIAWQAIVIDDNSTDDTPEKINNFIKNNRLKKQIQLIANSDRKFALYNVNDAVRNFIQCKDPIIGIIDGDDWLYDETSLQKIWNIYRDGYDLVWSQHLRWPSGQKGYSMPAKKGDHRHKRRGISHFKTFRRSAFLEIPEKEFLDANGEYLKYTYDKAITYPLSELSKKMFFLDEILYVYNQENAQNVDKKHAEEQYEISLYLEEKSSIL